MTLEIVDRDVVPPQSEDTEIAVLSAWLSSDRFANAWKPEPELFAIPSHRVLSLSLAKIDPKLRDDTAVLVQLEQDGTSKIVGGAPGLFRIRNCAPGYADPWPHLAKLRELAALRALMDGLAKATAAAYTARDLSGTVSLIQEALRAATAQAGSRVLSVADIFGAVAIKVQNGDVGKRCPSGLPTFDRHTGGFRAPHVAVLGAPTNWGKSSFAVMVCDEMMARQMRPLLVSWEDDEELYGRRLLARRTKVDATRLRDANPTDQERTDILGAIDRAERKPFFLDARGRSVERVATDIRSICESEGIDLVVGDYLQAVPAMRRSQDRRNEVTYVGRTLTDAIKSSNRAGLLLSQIRRLKSGEIPTKSDLKESGDLENAAEMVLLGYRDKKGTPTLVPDKVKDGLRGIHYQLAWHTEACCFVGEADTHLTNERYHQ